MTNHPTVAHSSQTWSELLTESGKDRPKEPCDLTFEISESHIPEGFLQKDVIVGSARHLIFATQDQLSILCDAKTWYLDGTFRIVRHPFVQLFSVHAFITSNGCTKQVPLAFVLMSRRRKIDYRKVIRAIKNILPSWYGMQRVFPAVRIRGCLFHWTQAVWRHMQDLGLKVAYTQRDNAYKFIRSLMALPFLPADHIQFAFGKLKMKASAPAMKSLVGYIEKTWIQFHVADYILVNF